MRRGEGRRDAKRRREGAQHGEAEDPGSGEIADRVKTDAALDAEVKADPKIGTARRGALPIKVGGEIIGALSVSGAPGGDKDEVCTQAGLDKIASRLK